MEYTLGNVMKQSFYDIVADKAKEIGFNVKFIYDENEKCNYLFIYLDGFDYLIPKYKELSRMIGDSHDYCGCGAYCKRIYPEASFSDCIQIIKDLYLMEFCAKLYIRNSPKIPSFVFNSHSDQLSYKMIIDDNTELFIREGFKEKLNSYFSCNSRMNNYKSAINTLNRRYLPSEKIIENLIDFNKEYRVNHNKNISFYELSQLGEIVSITLNVEDKSNIIACLIDQEDFFYSLDDDHEISYNCLKDYKGFDNYDLVEHDFGIYCLEKDIDKVWKCIMKIEYPNLHHLYNKNGIERVKQNDYVQFYVPIWLLKSFHSQAMRYGIEYYYMEKDDIVNLYGIPFIAPLKYYERLYVIMKYFIDRALKYEVIYCPDKELKIYPEAKYYADITGNYKIIPEKGLDKYLK